ncbi:hypothetical protein [Shewanella marina]|uniref:hypothetical protein n=1 Tax=Shewanella marina TaxID=487319 RepID=UPI00055BF1A3|nr:hypothetical protein [Shewanella marina]
MIKNNSVMYGLCAVTSLFSANVLADIAPEQEVFFDALRQHCGQAYAGTITAGDKDDATFGGKTLVMHVRECSDSVIKIPFHVGEDRSRTWVVTKTETGLRLKHDHRHQDGSEDKVTQYGGDTAVAGIEHKQSFPVDEFSKQMLIANNLPQAVTNVWHMYVTDDIFAYQLTRENRNFKVDFDLTTPITPPPAPWGHK